MKRAEGFRGCGWSGSVEGEEGSGVPLHSSAGIAVRDPHYKSGGPIYSPRAFVHKYTTRYCMADYSSSLHRSGRQYNHSFDGAREMHANHLQADRNARVETPGTRCLLRPSRPQSLEWKKTPSAGPSETKLDFSPHVFD